MKCKKRDGASKIEDVILRNTGYTDINAFLNGSKTVYTIKFLKEAVDMIKDAIKKKKIITIVGDYDADGITATAIMKMAIESLGGIVKVRIPHRLSEGYGISEKIIDEIDSGLIITVDNGIVAFDAIQKAKDKGLDVILTDHHLLHESGNIPCADIVIDPHIPGTADFEDYCGAGIAYKLCEELISNKILLDKLSCFAAIGTVSDVMPLIEDNRRIVIKGLKNMTTFGHRTSGLYSLLRTVQFDHHITATNIGFKIGPMINAPGRLEDDGSMKSLEVLTYDGPFDEEIGKELFEINETRKRMVEDALKVVEQIIVDDCLYGDYPLVIYVPGVHEGIVGLLAGKITESNQTPTFVLTDSETPGIYKGSGRTYGDFHLKTLLDKTYLRDPDIFVKYGGHAEAAGLSINADKLDDLMQIFQEIADSRPVYDDTVYYDLEINSKEVLDFIKEVEKYEPYGAGNPKILFKINDYSLVPRTSSYYQYMGDKLQHVKLYGIDMSATAFFKADRYRELSEPKDLNLIGSLSTNHFSKVSEVQIEIEDMEPINKSHTKTALERRLAEMSAKRYK